MNRRALRPTQAVAFPCCQHYDRRNPEHNQDENVSDILCQSTEQLRYYCQVRQRRTDIHLRTLSMEQSQMLRSNNNTPSSMLLPFPDGCRALLAFAGNDSATGLLLDPSQISTDLLQIVVETPSMFIPRLPDFLKNGIRCLHSRSPEALRAYKSPDTRTQSEQLFSLRPTSFLRC